VSLSSFMSLVLSQEAPC